ncbi:MAG: 50S ribosomal protein L24e [archaeon]
MKCTFCGKNMLSGTGRIYAKKDGTVFYFCSSKCRKNLLDKKYKQLKTKWTDSFIFEKKRHLSKKQQVATK